MILLMSKAKISLIFSSEGKTKRFLFKEVELEMSETTYRMTKEQLEARACQKKK